MAARKKWFLVFLFALAGALAALAPLPVNAARPVQRTFRIETSQFAYQPAVIRVDPGDTVTLEIVSTDVVHGLYVDGYGVSATADPGQTTRLTFVADKAGSFRLRCNVTCGALHPFMVGRLQVGPDVGLLRAIALTVLAVTAVLVLYPKMPKTKGSECAQN